MNYIRLKLYFKLVMTYYLVYQKRYGYDYRYIISYLISGHLCLNDIIQKYKTMVLYHY